MRKLIYPVLFLLIGLVLYFPIFRVGFAGDDTLQLVKYPYLHEIGATAKVFYKVIAIPNETHSIFTGYFYRPLTFSIYTILFNLTGANPVYFHILQFVFFIAGVFLLFLFFRSYFSEKLSFVLAAIFLVHPANNELGAYIAALGDTLCFVLGMGALLILNKSNKTNRTNKTNIKIFAVCLLLFLALLSKESGIIFVALVIIYLFWKKMMRFYFLPVLITTGIYLACRLDASQQTLFMSLGHPMEYPDFAHRLFLMPQTAYALLREIIIPSRDALSPGYFRAEFAYSILPIVMLCFFLVASIVFWRIIRRYNRNRATSFLIFLLWVVAGILPYVQFVQLEVMFADRWLYVSEIGVFGMLGVLGSVIPFKKNRWFAAGCILVGIVVLLYAIQTFVLNFLWLDWERHFV